MTLLFDEKVSTTSRFFFRYVVDTSDLNRDRI